MPTAISSPPTPTASSMKPTPTVVSIPFDILVSEAAIKHPSILTVHAAHGGIPLPVDPEHFALCVKFAREIWADSSAPQNHQLATDLVSRLYNETKMQPKGIVPPSDLAAQVDRLTGDVYGLQRNVHKIERKTSPSSLEGQVEALSARLTVLEAAFAAGVGLGVGRRPPPRVDSDAESWVATESDTE